MASNNPFLKIRSSKGESEKALSWYQDQIRSLSAASLRPNKLMQYTPQLKQNVLPGYMYMFFYDAKYQDILPFWDKFPLVLPFRKVENGFYGINLHYLPYIMRFNLLGKLHDLASDEKITEKTRIRISWNALNSIAGSTPLKNCVKHYLIDHVQSKFLNIPYPDWVTASLLPVERFVGATKQQVWQRSRESM